jgi:gas vesicle protein
VLGLAVGAGLALLFAPQAGEDTRRSIVRRGRKLTDRGRDAWDDLRDELRRAAKRRRREKQERDDDELP